MSNDGRKNVGDHSRGRDCLMRPCHCRVLAMAMHEVGYFPAENVCVARRTFRLCRIRENRIQSSCIPPTTSINERVHSVWTQAHVLPDKSDDVVLEVWCFTTSHGLDGEMEPGHCNR